MKKEKILNGLIVELAKANASCKLELGTRAETMDVDWSVREKIIRAFLIDLLDADEDERLSDLMSTVRCLLEENFKISDFTLTYLCKKGEGYE